MSRAARSDRSGARSSRGSTSPISSKRPVRKGRPGAGAARSAGSAIQASPFLRIWKVVARIPRGQVATYGQVARLAGYHGAARLAGWALAALPDGFRIGGRPVPWHRVINAAGRISPRAGEAIGETSRQALRLESERVPAGRGRIDLKRYGWDGR